MYLHHELFTYDECHKVLADGRIVEIDSAIGKGSRRFVGVAKELWDRLPHLRARLNLLGPSLFTDERVAGGRLPDLSETSLAQQLLGGEDEALGEIHTYDDGLVIKGDDVALVDPPAAPLPGDIRPLWPDEISINNFDLKRKL